MADTMIKPDPEGASPGFVDDIYEDAGDLEFNDDPKFSNLFLARVPQHLWKAWKDLDDNAEIQVGQLRRRITAEPGGLKGESYSLILSPDLAQHQLLPKEYDMDVTEQNAKNTYVFTEQNLPGYRQKDYNPNRDIPARLRKERENDKALEKKRKFNITGQDDDDPDKKDSRYGKPIPKRMRLFGKVHLEATCIAVEGEAEKALIRNMAAVRAALPQTSRWARDEDVHLEGTLQTLGKFGDFIRTSSGAAIGAKPQLQKTARMPQNELLDRIFDCFRDYKYWPMKAFRSRLQQPEAYLRETLEKIAVLARSGRFTGSWSLKPENQLVNEPVEEGMAPDGGSGGVMGGSGEGDSEMGDGEEDFEDVLGQ